MQIPLKKNSKDDQFVPEQCLMYKRTENTNCSIASDGSEVEECNKWVFDSSDKTIVQDVSK